MPLMQYEQLFQTRLLSAQLLILKK